MAINTYEESFGETIQKHLGLIIAVVTLLAVVLLAFFGVRWYLDRNAPAIGSVDTSGLVRDFNFKSGKSDSAVRVVYIIDLECPACKQNSEIMKKVKSDNSSKVEFVYKNFPLPIHTFAKNAAYGSMASGRQGKYFEYVERVYELQDNLNNATLEQIARELNLDYDKWNSDRNSTEIRDQVDQDVKDIQNVNMPSIGNEPGGKISATPTTVILKDSKVVDWWSGVLDSDINSASSKITDRINKQL